MSRIKKMKATQMLPPFLDLLVTKVEGLNDCAVTLDINLLQVHKQLTTLTYKTQQRTLRTVVVTVALHVLGKVVDTVGKKCYLALRRTSIYFRSTVLTEKLLLFLCVQITHCFVKI